MADDPKQAEDQNEQNNPEASSDADKTGITEHTEGKKFAFYGAGSASITANSNMAITYGVSNSVSLGLDNTFSLAVKTATNIGMNFTAGLSGAFAFTKDSSVKHVSGTNSYAETNHNLSVGAANVAANLRIKRIRTAIFVAVSMQAALLAAQTIYTIERATATYKKGGADSNSPNKITLDAETEDDKRPTYIFSGITAAMNVLTMISAVIMMAYKKVKDAQTKNPPVSVLSLDVAPVAFLGTKGSVPSKFTNGITLDGTGVSIVAVDTDLEYIKYDKSETIIGLSDQELNDKGAIVKLWPDGFLDVVATESVFISRETEIHKCEELQVSILDNPSELKIDANGQILTADANTDLNIHKDSGISARSKEAALKLEGAAATLSFGGNEIKASAAGVELTYGATNIKLNAAGVSIGGALTILHPGAGKLQSSSLLKLKQLSGQNIAKTKSLAAKNKANTTKLKLMNEAIKRSNQALLQVRATAEQAAELAQDAGKK